MNNSSQRVVVIGAGAAGVSTAYHLAKADADVVLLDKGFVAGETTGKAAGLVYYQMHEPADVRAMDYSFEFFHDLAAAENDFKFHVTGHLRIGTENERSTFEHEVAMQRSEGVDAKIVGPDEIASLSPDLNLEGITVGTYCPDDAHADPYTYAVTLLSRAEERGVDYNPKTKAIDIDVKNGAVSAVETEAGTLEADTVVITAGPWSKEIARMAGVEIPVKPYRTQALVTTEVDSQPIPIFDAADSVYFRSEQGGLLAGDGTEERESDPDDYKETGDFSFLTEVGATLQNRLDISNPGVQNSWVGLSSATPDGFPLVGRPPVTPASDEYIDGLYVGTGLQGHGFMRSPAVGRMLAAEILGHSTKPQYPDYRPDRFESDPGDFDIDELMKLEGKHSEYA